MAELVLVLALQAVNARSAIELSTEDFVSLDETLELASEVSVLSLEALGVLLESFPFSSQITVVGAVLGRGDPEALNIASSGQETILLLLQANLAVTDLN